MSHDHTLYADLSPDKPVAGLGEQRAPRLRGQHDPRTRLGIGDRVVMLKLDFQVPANDGKFGRFQFPCRTGEFDRAHEALYGHLQFRTATASA